MAEDEIDFQPLGFQEEDSIDFEPVEFQADASLATGTQGEEKQSFVGRVVDKLGKAYTEATTPVYAEGGMIDTLPRMGEKILRTAGHLGSAAGDVLSEGVKGLYNLTTTEETRKRQAETLDYLANTDFMKSQKQTFKGLRDAYGTFAKENPRIAEDLEATANAINLIPAYQVGKAIAQPTKSAVSGAFRFAKEKAYPPPSPEEAIKQVLQSPQKTPAMAARDVEKGRKALEVVNTEGVTSYGELSKRLENAKPVYAEMVDTELLKDPKAYTLKDLETVQKTKGGVEVRSNYVSDALDNLEELYTKTNEPVRATEIAEIRAKAEAHGLNRKEVNDIARTYNVEFGSKAFSPATGEALTSVNAQSYENVRKGLKDVARQGLTDEAKELDSILSSIYNTQRLVDRNFAAAERLKAKVDERGFGEKIGRAALTALDVATMGTVKGAVLKLLPRGLGYKVKNYIDLEESLKRNLKIINDEIKRVEKKSVPKGTQSITSAEPSPTSEDAFSVRNTPYLSPEEVDMLIPYYEKLGKQVTTRGLPMGWEREPLALPPGQGFEIVGGARGGPYHPAWLPQASEAVGEGFTSQPRTFTSAMNPTDVTRQMLKPDIGNLNKYGVIDIEAVGTGEKPTYMTAREARRLFRKYSK